MKAPLEIRIYYEDTDCGEIVYYANYLRYFERARTEFLRQKGISVAQLASEGILFVVIEASLRYIAPAKYDDLIVVHTEVTELGGASFILSHDIVEKHTNKLLVQGFARLACVKTGTGKPIKLPELIKDGLKNS